MVNGNDDDIEKRQLGWLDRYVEDTNEACNVLLPDTWERSTSDNVDTLRLNMYVLDMNEGNAWYGCVTAEFKAGTTHKLRVEWEDGIPNRSFDFLQDDIPEDIATIILGRLKPVEVTKLWRMFKGANCRLADIQNPHLRALFEKYLGPALELSVEGIAEPLRTLLQETLAGCELQEHDDDLYCQYLAGSEQIELGFKIFTLMGGEIPSDMGKPNQSGWVVSIYSGCWTYYCDMTDFVSKGWDLLASYEPPYFAEDDIFAAFRSKAEMQTDGASPYQSELEVWERPEPRLSDVAEAAAIDVMHELLDVYAEGGEEAVEKRFLEIMRERRQFNEEMENTEPIAEEH